MAISDVDQTTLPKQLQGDKDSGRLSEITQHIYGQLLSDQTPGQTQQANFDRTAATKFLQEAMLLPGITITGIDTIGGKNGTGLQITDTGSGNEEHYTLDPKTGIAKSEDGVIEAIYYPDGRVQRFNYETDPHTHKYVLENGKPKLTDVIDADGKKWHLNQDGTADYIDPKDHTQTRVHSDGKLSINPDSGEITITNDKDGTKEVHQPNGSMVKTNSDGLVTDILFPYDQSTGKRGAMHFAYTGKDLTEVVDQAGQTWDKKDGKWQSKQKGADGQDQIVTSPLGFSVGPSGISIMNLDGSQEIYSPDGTKC